MASTDSSYWHDDSNAGVSSRALLKNPRDVVTPIEDDKARLLLVPSSKYVCSHFRGTISHNAHNGVSTLYSL